jgi:hypothetical protein
MSRCSMLADPPLQHVGWAKARNAPSPRGKSATIDRVAATQKTVGTLRFAHPTSSEFRSFPRKGESKYCWVPAFAGMSGQRIAWSR